MMKRSILALALLGPVAANAEMSYSYIEAGVEFGTVAYGPNDYDITSFLAEGSFAIHNNVALQVGGEAGNIDLPSPLEVHFSEFHVAVLGHAPATEAIDIFLGAALGRVEYEIFDGINTFTDDDRETTIMGGVRVQAAERLEVEARVASADSFGSRSEGFDVGLRVHSKSKLSGSVFYNTWPDDDVSGVTVGLRIDL